MTEQPKNLGITPSQTVGPFFSYGLTPREYGRVEFVTEDVTVPGEPGQRIRVEGQVFDGDGAPVTDAMIEIWQADSEGKYASEADGRRQSNTGFKGFGRAPTDKTGTYVFTTIKPGRVPGADGALQAPHLSVSVLGRGLLNRLHTRIYFEDEDANASDAVLKLVPVDLRPTLIAKRSNGSGETVYRFDIRLQGDGETVFFEA